MASYKCFCGHSWSDLSGHSDGYICWQNSQMNEQLAQNMLAFCEASLNNRRSEWLSKFFGIQHPVELSNEAVASDISAALSNSYASLVFRCPRCSNITVYEDGRWISYHEQKRQALFD